MLKTRFGNRIQWLAFVFKISNPKLVLLDLFLLISSFLIAFWLRSDLEFKVEIPKLFYWGTTLYVFGFIFVGTILGLYRRKYLFASFEEILAISTQAFFGMLISVAFSFLIVKSQYPRSLPIIASLIFVVFCLTLRVVQRINFNSLSKSEPHASNVLIYGAGMLGRQISEIVNLDNKSKLVGFIDDDPNKLDLTIRSKKIIGNIDVLEEIVSHIQVSRIIIAISDLESKKKNRIIAFCSSRKIKLSVVPTASELLLGVDNLNQLVEIQTTEILGRDEVKIDTDAIEKKLTGKRILITGAGGSIGSEIAKQCMKYHPETVYILDRDESALHALELSLFGTGLMSSSNIVLADIRDDGALEEIFLKYRPNIVFHAAALKHLPILEKYPEEAYKTNVLGTKNVLDVSQAIGVEVFVNISTDKAADPTSVLGRTKLEAEKLTKNSALSDNTTGSKYISVRFGNVIGSRGSVIHTFKYQIENDFPVTITDPEATRYFMTVSEAVSLVLQSAVEGISGETLILDMGKPIKILDVARFLIKQSGKKENIVFTGLRDGEKLHEDLSSSVEGLVNRGHPKIFHAVVEANS